MSGSGVFKQAVDAAFQQQHKKSSGGNLSFLKTGNDCTETALLQAAADEISSSELRGLEEVYSPAIQVHREKVVKTILAASSNQSAMGHRRFAKLAAEESLVSAKFARMVGIADAKQVQR